MSAAEVAVLCADSRPGEGLAARSLFGLSIAVTVVLVLFAHGYGYHRDALYFLVAGSHPDGP